MFRVYDVPMSIRKEVRSATVNVTDVLLAHGITLDTYAVLAVYEALETHIPAPATVMEFTHDALVARALSSRKVMEEVFLNRKINAIKELRQITGCNLKQAKEAIEDDRVWPGQVPPE